MARVLILCPHNAAKSVLAAAYLEQLAAARGLDVSIETAGTEPDAVISPAVAALLREEGIDVSGSVPKRVTPEQLARADRVISMGCTLDELGGEVRTFEMWNGIPATSDDLRGARDAIHTKVEQLVVELANNGD